MELKILTPQDAFLASIEWNHEEIKAELTEKIQHYNTLVYTDAEIKDAKADRASLNKFAKALDDKRKEVKKQCLLPYESFEKKMKEIQAIVAEPIGIIDKQIKDFENEKATKKLEEIKTYFDSKDPVEGIEIPFERFFDKRWLNATASMKSITECIDTIFSTASSHLNTMKDLPYSFEAIECYKKHFDYDLAVSEARRIYEMQKMKAEQEAKTEQSAVTFADAELPVEEPIQEAEIIHRQEVVPEWIAFRALVTVPQALTLRDFFLAQEITFEPIKDKADTAKALYLLECLNEAGVSAWEGFASALNTFKERYPEGLNFREE